VLLDARTADRARSATADIAAALTAADLPDASPSSGKAGVALFLTAFGATEEATTLFESAIDQVVEGPVDVGLYGTTVGLGWALSIVEGRLTEVDEDESDVDALVARVTSVDPWPAHYDLVRGLVGLGVYALERLPRASARTTLDNVVGHLARTARRDADGARWWTTPEMFRARATQYPDGHYDIGLAHGVAGAVALLAEAVRAGVPEAEPLLEESARWLRAQRGADGRYPATIGPDGRPEPARLAWCYGDAGVATALLAAGEAMNDATLVAEARDLAAGSAARGDTGVVDAGLCHGSAGLGHVFHRMGSRTGDERLLDLARSWFVRTLDERDAMAAYAGFPARRAVAGEVAEWPVAGLLEGAAGVGLALLAAASDEAPWWDALLLVRS
jgi:lantibiotic modifying enzyme